MIKGEICRVLLMRQNITSLPRPSLDSNQMDGIHTFEKEMCLKGITLICLTSSEVRP